MYSQHIQLLAILAVGCTLTSAAAAPYIENVQPENAARFDNYRFYRIHLETDAQVKVFQELERISDSMVFYGFVRYVGQRLTVTVPAHMIADFTELLQRFNVEHTIMIHNFQETIDNNFRSVKPRNTPGREMDWEHFFHLDTIYDWLDDLAVQHPDKISLINLGRSYEGRQIKGVKLSSGPGRTGIFIEGGIHAREWISPSTATFVLNQLLTSSDPDVQDIASSFDWYFVPVVNPDGYSFAFEGDRMWRKTRKPNAGVCVGVDMNRNFDLNWNGTGSSPDPCRQDFAGPAVESEPETANIARFILENRNTSRIETYIALHSFSQLIMFPYGHTAVKPPNYDDLKSIGTKGVEGMARRYGTKYQTGSSHEIIYPSSGGSMDWAYVEANIPISYTIELRGAPDSEFMFILPAEQITPVGLETLDAFVAMLNEARRLGYYDSKPTEN